MNERLQFRHHGNGSGYTTIDGVFESRDAAIEYITRDIRYSEEGLAAENPSHGFSLFAEPTVLRYKNDENEEDPHVILAIGSVTNTGNRYNDNKFCIIDIDKTEKEIAELNEAISGAVKSLSLIVLESDTLKLNKENTEEGVVLSGDVKVPEDYIFDGERTYKDNAILKTENGIFTFVDLEYDDVTEKFTFTLNNSKKEFRVGGDYVVSGEYTPIDESLHLHMKHGDDIVVNLENLIDEWVVEGDAAKSPIILTREEVGYGDDSAHHHVEPWQDILSADVRIADDRVNNILKKTTDNRYLYVDGVASNIVYYKNGVKTNVQEALNSLPELQISTDSNNIITSKPDGFFASTKLEYISNDNTLIFTTSSNDEDERRKETRIKLNSFKLFERIDYISEREILVITYIDGEGNTKFVEIPIGEMIADWEWSVNNYGHSVFLQKERQVQGPDKLSADVNIFQGNNNILEDVNHQLYVKGTADNIKYGSNSNVEEEIVKLNNKDSLIVNSINEETLRAEGAEQALGTRISAEASRAEAAEQTLSLKVDAETSRATLKENEIKSIIGEGFSTDSHETVTYKFDAIDTKVDSEIERSTAKDTELETAINDEIQRSTNKDAEHDADIATIKNDLSGKIEDIINTDHTIGIDKSDALNPVIGVNLSTEVEDGKQNLIKINADGLYAGVDLLYEFNETVGTNQLIFKTTYGTKTFDLQTNSSIDKIYYDPSRESIVIEYTVNGRRMPDVVIPLGELINEWRIWDGHDGAIQLEKQRVASGTSEQDVLKASVVISDTHDDNIIINDNGALYVSGQQITDNKNAIDSLDEKIDAEISRATNAEAAINNKADVNTYSIANEIVRATSAETALNNAIAAEKTRAESVESALSDKIDEIEGKTHEISVEDTTTIDLTFENDRLSGNVIIANGNENIIKATPSTISGSGLYASVDIEYNPATNKLKLITSAAEKEVSLSNGSIIKSIEYDPIGKNIIIKYDVNIGGEVHEETVFVPVEDLFNEWDVVNLPENSAIELTKENSDTGTDKLSARVLITNLTDNMVSITNNGLYVSRRPIDEVSGAVVTLREDFEGSLGTEETSTLNLYRNVRNNNLLGDVKLSPNEPNLLRIDGNNGLIFDGRIDCGEY